MKYASGSVKQALADRVSMSEAVETVGKLLDCYPNRSQAGRAYIGALASVLVGYPAAVVRQGPDPLRGLPAEKTFGLPAVADLIAWCERETAPLRGVVDRGDHYDKLAREQQQRAEDEAKLIEQRKQRPTYDDIKAKHGPNWGITVEDENMRAAKDQRAAQLARANRVLFERECTAAGMDPNSLISPSLRKILHPEESQPQREAAE